MSVKGPPSGGEGGLKTAGGVKLTLLLANPR